MQHSPTQMHTCKIHNMHTHLQSTGMITHRTDTGHTHMQITYTCGLLGNTELFMRVFAFISLWRWASKKSLERTGAWCFVLCVECLQSYTAWGLPAEGLVPHGLPWTASWGCRRWERIQKFPQFQKKKPEAREGGRAGVLLNQERFEYHTVHLCKSVPPCVFLVPSRDSANTKCTWLLPVKKVLCCVANFDLQVEGAYSKIIISRVSWVHKPGP
jgi:hypothetical protein